MSRITGGAARTSRTSAPASELHFVTFHLGHWEYGIEVADVCGIYHGLAIIPAPDEPDTIAGEVHLPTHRIRVIDLRRLLQLPESESPGWMLVVGAVDGPIGILVDRVTEVIRVRSDAMAAYEDADGRVPGGGFLTVTAHYQGRTIYVPDVHRMLRGCCG